MKNMSLNSINQSSTKKVEFAVLSKLNHLFQNFVKLYIKASVLPITCHVRHRHTETYHALRQRVHAE